MFPYSGDRGADVLPLEKRVRRPIGGSSETDEGDGAREREAEAISRGVVSRQADPEGYDFGVFLSLEPAAVRGGASAKSTKRASDRPAGCGAAARDTTLCREETLTEAIVTLGHCFRNHGKLLGSDVGIVSPMT